MTEFFDILQQKIEFTPSEEGVAKRWFQQIERDNLFSNSISSSGGGGGVSGLQAGNVTIDLAEGVTLRNPDNGVRTIYLDPDGDAFFGSDIDDPASTAFSVFSNEQVYNSESMGAGDLLLGDNSANRANIWWDASAGQLKFRGGTTEGIVLDTDGTITVGVSTPNIIIDGVNKNIRSSNYVAGASGFQLDAVNGDAEFNNITARGTFRTSVFQFENLAAVGGHLLVSKSAAEVATEVTTAATFTLVLKNDDVGAVLVAQNDILEVKGWNGSELIDVYVTAGVVTDLGATASFTATLQSGGTGKVLKRGMGVANLGQSGGGIIRLQAGDLSDATVPTRFSIATHAGAPWSTLTNQIILGDMYNTFGASTNHRYGIGIGDYAGGNYLSYNAEGASEFWFKAGSGAVNMSSTGLELWDQGDLTSQIIWLYDDSGTERFIGGIYGSEGGAAPDNDMRVYSKREAGDPWNDAAVTLNVEDTVNSLNGFVVLKTSDFSNITTLAIDVDNIHATGGMKIGTSADYGLGVGDLALDDDLFVGGGMILGKNSGTPTDKLIMFFNGATQVGDIGNTLDTTWLRFNQGTAKNLYTPRIWRIDGGIATGSTLPGATGDINIAGDSALQGGLYVGSASPVTTAGRVKATEDVFVGGGITVGGTSNPNPSAGEVMYDANLVVYKNSTQYDAYAFVPLTTSIRILNVTGGSAVGPTYVSLSSLPNNIQAVAVRVVFRDTTARSNTFYLGVGPSSTDYFAVVTRTHIVGYWDENSGISPVWVGGNPRRLYYRASGTASSLDYNVDVYGYYI
jgi:hypothetical protein